MWQNLLCHCVVFTKASEEFAPYYLAEIRHDIETNHIFGAPWHPTHLRVLTHLTNDHACAGLGRHAGAPGVPCGANAAAPCHPPATNWPRGRRARRPRRVTATGRSAGVRRDGWLAATSVSQTARAMGA